MSTSLARARDSPSTPMSDMLGRRVSIFWDGDDKYFDGTVREFAMAMGKHLVVFDARRS